MKSVTPLFSSVVTVLLMLELSGCDQLSDKNRYEIKQDTSGRTIRLDKQTGEIAILEGGKLVPASTAADQQAADQTRRAAEARSAQPRYRSVKSFESIGVKTATMLTMWRDGKLFFQMSLSPAPKPSVRAWGIGLTRFRIDFLDAAGFNVVDEPIPISNTVNALDPQGKSASFEVNWSIPMSQQAYESISDWTITWLL